MHQRDIEYSDIKTAIESAIIVQEYIDDKPLVSALVLGFAKGRALHAVVAPKEDEILWIITVYEPSADKWEPDFLKRRGEK